jgi:hypothetical protein
MPTELEPKAQPNRPSSGSLDVGIVLVRFFPSPTFPGHGSVLKQFADPMHPERRYSF